MTSALIDSAFVLAVPDATASARWWTDVMGFDLTLSIDGWSFVRRGACEIRMGSCPDAPPIATLGDHQYFGYVRIEEIDAYHTEIVARGAEILFPPRDQPWGFREFGVRTMDAHRIMFGQSGYR